MNFNLIASEHATWTVLRLSGRIDAFNDRDVLLAFSPHMVASTTHYVLELSNCESLNLRILRELMRWAEHLRSLGGELVIMDASVTVKRSVEIFVGPHRIRQIAGLSDLSLMQIYGNRHILPEIPSYQR